MTSQPASEPVSPNLTGQVQRRRVETLGRRLLTVSRVEDLTPNYRRVHLVGPDLDAGFPYVRLAVGDHVKVLFPQPGSKDVTLPEPGRPVRETAEGAPRPAMRDFTVRGWDEARRELVLEFVLHGSAADGSAGVASSWARNARVGDRLGVLGPRGNSVYPENYAWYLLAGDETALPALSRLVEELPEGARAHVVIEAADEREKRTITERPGFEVTWAGRGNGGAGALANAVRAVPLPKHDDWFAFAAGEVSAMKAVRDYLRLEIGLPAQRVSVDGYWKRGVADLDHHAIDLDKG